jgi:hypothetical protein
VQSIHHTTVLQACDKQKYYVPLTPEESTNTFTTVSQAATSFPSYGLRVFRRNVLPFSSCDGNHKKQTRLWNFPGTSTKCALTRGFQCTHVRPLPGLPIPNAFTSLLLFTSSPYIYDPAHRRKSDVSLQQLPLGASVASTSWRNVSANAGVREVRCS